MFKELNAAIANSIKIYEKKLCPHKIDVKIKFKFKKKIQY